LIIED